MLELKVEFAVEHFNYFLHSRVNSLTSSFAVRSVQLENFRALLSQTQTTDKQINRLLFAESKLQCIEKHMLGCWFNKQLSWTIKPNWPEWSLIKQAS